MIQKIVMLGNTEPPLTRMAGYKSARIVVHGLQSGNLFVHEDVITVDGEYPVSTLVPLRIRPNTESKVIVKLIAEVL